MTEYIAQMTPMLLLAGVSAAWVNEAVSGARGYGFMRGSGFMYDLAIGIAGSLLAGVIVSFVMSDAGMTAMFVFGCLGAALAITVQRRFWGSVRPRS